MSEKQQQHETRIMINAHHNVYVI